MRYARQNRIIELISRYEIETQEKLAELAELSTQSISDIEGLRTWVSDRALERLARVFNIDIYRLFMPQDEKIKNNPELLFYKRIEKLQTEINEEIEKKLNQFYLSEKFFSK